MHLAETREEDSFCRQIFGMWPLDYRDDIGWPMASISPTSTSGSARCLGREDIGVISVGKQADLALFDRDEFSFSGAGAPLAALALCGAHGADRVMVAG